MKRKTKRTDWSRRVLSFARASRRVTTLAGLLVFATPASGSEPLPFRAERLIAPGRNVASDDSVEAIRVNPANLAFLPAPELRWTGIRCPDTKMVGCGHAFGIATPLLFDVVSGLRVDYLQPPASADFPLNVGDYAWITWAFGFRIGEALAFGGSVQRSYSTNAYTNGLWGLSAGVTYRPNSHVAVAALTQDFNNPSPSTALGTGVAILDRSYVFGLAIRPTGRRAFEVGAELQVQDSTGQVLPRATVGLDVPHLGRLRGDVQVAHLPNDQARGVVGSAGLEVAFGGFGVGAGALFGNGLGGASNVAEYGTVCIAGFRSPGVARPARAVTLRIERTPGVRAHLHLLERLWKLAEARDVDAVTLILRTEPVTSFAHAEELADAIRVLRAHGKKVLCSLEDNGARSLYVCANADRIVLNPAGGLRYSGLRTQYFYLAGLLSKLGIQAEFIRIGAHKSAPEQFTNDHASEVSHADHEDFLRQVESVFNRNLAKGRKLSIDQVKVATAKGPFLASEAEAVGFIDGVAFDDEVDRVTQELVGRSIRVEKLEDETVAPDTFGPRGRVGVLYVDGDMVDGRSQNIPLLDTKLVGSYTIAEAARALREDPWTKSVVLRIESGGGSSMAADVMWRELVLLAKKKPLIVSMGSAAASGGYYIAAAGTTIYALPLTLTGSIGIFYGKADVSGLLQKIGVTVETYKTTPRADAESFFRAFTDEEREELKRKIGQFYDVFLDRVSQGRHMSKADVDAVGQGRVWTGEQAYERKLVDHLGGFREALAAAREAGKLPRDAPILELPEIRPTLLEQGLKLIGFDQAKAMTPITALPAQVREIARALAPMAIFKSDIPLARAEWMPADPPGEED